MFHYNHLGVLEELLRTRETVAGTISAFASQNN
jgi:hypothetical protein